jgi:spore coat protein U-like protein
MRALTAAAVVLSLLAGGARESVAGSCAITDVASVALGSYDVFDLAPLDSSGTLTYECTGVQATDSIRIEISAGGSGTFSPRAMSAGAAALSYNLYLDAARISVWGDGSGGTSTYGPLQPAEGSTSIPIYGRAPGGQNASPGNYGDTVVVTLVF